MGSMTLSEKRRYFTRQLARLLVYGMEHDFEIALDFAKRSKEEQKRLVEAGLSQTMKSKHVEGLAVDLLLYDGSSYLVDPKAYAPLGAYWVSLDPKNVWGGNWHSIKDYGHFEYAG